MEKFSPIDYKISHFMQIQSKISNANEHHPCVFLVSGHHYHVELFAFADDDHMWL